MKSMDESQRHFAKCKKSDPKTTYYRFPLYDIQEKAKLQDGELWLR